MLRLSKGHEGFCQLIIHISVVTRQCLQQARVSIVRQVSDSGASGSSYQPTATCRVHHNLSPPLHTVTDPASVSS